MRESLLGCQLGLMPVQIIILMAQLPIEENGQIDYLNISKLIEGLQSNYDETKALKVHNFR